MRALIAGIGAGAWLGGAFGLLRAAFLVVIEQRYPTQGLQWLAIETAIGVCVQTLAIGAAIGGVTALPLASGLSPRRALPVAIAVGTVASFAAIVSLALEGGHWQGYRAEHSVLQITLRGAVAAVVALAVGAFLARVSGRHRPGSAGRPASVGSLAPLLVAVGLAAAPAWLRPVPVGPNLLLISVDTLRPDRLSPYGYAKARTPNVDRLARSGLLYETVVASAPVTLPATATLMTGLDPPQHGVHYNGYYRLRPDALTLAEVLADRGYETAAFVANFALDSSFGIAQGFATYDDTMIEYMEEATPGGGRPRRTRETDPWFTTFRRTQPSQRYADELTDAALAWLDGRGERPFLLWVHYMDPHRPYAPPAEFADGDPYDGEVAFVDREIGRLLGALDEIESERPTLVVFVSDHGESLGEHDYFGHVKVLFETTLRVPLILKLEGAIPEGRRETTPLRAREFAGEVLRHLQVEAPESFAPKGEPLRSTDEGWAYAETYQPVFTGGGLPPRRALRSERWKLIHQEGHGRALFDLIADPGEENDVSAELVDVADSIERRLRDASEGASDTPGAIDPSTRERLRALGYVD